MRGLGWPDMGVAVVRSVEVVGRTGGGGYGTAGPASSGDCARLAGTSRRGDAFVPC
jgi:hypothetical protein